MSVLLRIALEQKKQREEYPKQIEREHVINGSHVLAYGANEWFRTTSHIRTEYKIVDFDKKNA